MTNRNLIFVPLLNQHQRISVEWLFFSPTFSFSTVIAISPFLVLNSRFPVNFLSRTKYLLQLSQRGSDFLAFNSTPSWLGANLKANETPTAKKDISKLNSKSSSSSSQQINFLWMDENGNEIAGITGSQGLCFVEFNMNFKLIGPWHLPVGQ